MTTATRDMSELANFIEAQPSVDDYVTVQIYIGERPAVVAALRLSTKPQQTQWELIESGGQGYALAAKPAHEATTATNTEEMTMPKKPSREFPLWHVIAKSSGLRFGDPCHTYSDAHDRAKDAFVNLDRTERFQVFHDDGSGKFTMMYDATKGEPLFPAGIGQEEMQLVEGRGP